MTVAAAQYAKFREQVAREGRAFTFTAPDGLLVYRVAAGETIPFWSSRSRLEGIRRRLPKYGQWQIAQLTLVQLYGYLAHMERDGVLAGVNWSGAELTGYNVPAAELRAGLDYWLGRLGKGNPHDRAV